jgi:EpsI family protein
VNIAVYQMAAPGHNPERVPVNKFVMGKGLERQLYLFWYHGRGRIYASEYWNKIYLIWDGLTKKRTDGALVRVNIPIIGNTEEALKTQSDFIQLFLPLLKEYIPD